MANLILNPSFEVDSNADGLADNWAVLKTVAGVPTTSRVAGLFGSYAQRIAYTGAADTNKLVGVWSDMTAVGSVAAGNNVSGGLWARVTQSGAQTLTLTTYSYDAAGFNINSVTTVLNQVPQNIWFHIPSFHLMPANASRLRCAVYASAIDTGDSVTLDIDGAYLSPDSNFDFYGKYPVIGGAL